MNVQVAVDWGVVITFKGKWTMLNLAKDGKKKYSKREILLYVLLLSCQNVAEGPKNWEIATEYWSISGHTPWKKEKNLKYDKILWYVYWNVISELKHPSYFVQKSIWIKIEIKFLLWKETWYDMRTKMK